MARAVTMDPYGNFSVSDDPQGAIAAALFVAANNAPLVRAELSPEGNGLQIEGIGSLRRATTRESLPSPFDEDPSFAPETQELWRLFRASDSQYSAPGRFVLHGDELRALVARALVLRER